MVDGNDGTSLPDAFSIHFDRRLRERRVDVVYWDRVVRVGGIARNVHYDGQPARVSSLSHEFGSDKLGNGLGEVDAVDKYVHWSVSVQLDALRGTLTI